MAEGNEAKEDPGENAADKFSKGNTKKSTVRSS